MKPYLLFGGIFNCHFQWQFQPDWSGCLSIKHSVSTGIFFWLPALSTIGYKSHFPLVSASNSRCMSCIPWHFSNSTGHIVWIVEPKILDSALVYAFFVMFYERYYSNKIKKKWVTILTGTVQKAVVTHKKMNCINHRTIFSCKYQSRPE